MIDLLWLLVDVRLRCEKKPTAKPGAQGRDERMERAAKQHGSVKPRL
jgi:hypothetical protein